MLQPASHTPRPGVLPSSAGAFSPQNENLTNLGDRTGLCWVSLIGRPVHHRWRIEQVTGCGQRLSLQFGLELGHLRLVGFNIIQVPCSFRVLLRKSPPCENARSIHGS
jgi:hypothetical protein